MNPERLKIQNIKKGWGNEVWIVNNEKYCCKFLNFDNKSKFSMHFHKIKDETWHILKGNFKFKWINTNNADIIEEELKEGDTVRIPTGLIHQLEVMGTGQVLEVSTQHLNEDNYRVIKR